MIETDFGRLGKGKTLDAVIKAYDAYLEGREVFSNIWLDFPHTPIKEPMDFLAIEEGLFLADELWHLADNRKSMSLLSDVITIILLRSRKRDFDVKYTQQYMQIDVRIAFVTDVWVKPRTVPDHETCKALKMKPQELILERWNGDFERMPPLRLDCAEYCDLYDTKKDPYTLSAFVTNEHLKSVLKRALEGQESEFKSITEQAKSLKGEEKRKKLSVLS